MFLPALCSVSGLSDCGDLGPGSLKFESVASEYSLV